MKIKLTKPFVFLCTLLCFSVVALLFNQQNVLAASDTFDGTLDVAIYGPNAHLQAPETRVKVYGSSGGSNYTVTVRDACKDMTAGNPGLRATYNGVTRSSNNASDCNGDDIVFNNQPAGGRTLVLEKINGQGHQPFRVTVSNPAASSVYVTQLANPNPTRSNNIDNWTGGEENASFAVWAGNGYSIEFQPTCSDLANEETVYFKWEDADDGAGDNQNKNASIEVIYEGPGGFPNKTVNKGNVGGQGVKGHIAIALDKNYSTYKVVWSGITGGNAIQMVSPYEKNPGRADCEKPPIGEIGASSCTAIKGWAYDPNFYSRHLHIRVTATSTNGTAQITGVSDQNEYNNGSQGHPDGHGWNLSPPGLSTVYGDGTKNVTIRLEAHDINADSTEDSAWITLATDTRTKPCDVPGGSGSLGACDVTVNFTIPSDGVKVRVYARTSNDSDPFDEPEVYNENHFATANMNLGNFPGNGGKTGLDNLRSNYGFVVLVKPLDSSGNPTGGNTEDSTGNSAHRNYATGTCFDASCSVNIALLAPLPGNGVFINQPFNFTLTITNNRATGTIPRMLDGSMLGMTQAGGDFNFTPIVLDKPVLGGSSATSDPQTFNGPVDNSSIRHIKGYPDFIGKMGIGGVCDTNVIPYDRYDHTVTTGGVLDDEESPANATFTTTITQVGSYAVDGTVTRTFEKDRNGVRSPLPLGPLSTAGTYGTTAPPITDPFPITPGSYQFGDSYCVAATLDHGYGWVGPPGYIVHEGSRSAASNCSAIVTNKPYVRVYGTDVAAGGGFGVNCTNASSNILTFMRPLSEQTAAGDRSGSGVGLAAMALGNIKGFTSASIRTVSPMLPNDLTFAHSSPPTNAIDALMGGNMGGQGWCAPDYFQETPYPVGNALRTDSTSSSPININTLADGRQTMLKPTGGSVRLIGTGGGAQNYNSHHTLYVEGDVSIKNNIRYVTSYSGGIATIPNFTLVVKGNIYIDQDTKFLDGLYIAQPDPGRPNSGRIFTCATSDLPVTGSLELFTECGAGGHPNQLVVNGAFVAQRVVLNRTVNSIRDSRYKEPADTSRAAEVFKFSPELYLSPPIFRPKTSLTSGEYQYITSLPPIL